MSEHMALSWADECYYLLEFFPGNRYGFRADNDLIKNFKRRIDECGVIALKYKEWAIRDTAQLLRPALASLLDFATVTIVPIPPSRVRANLYYDDRVARVLRLASPAGADIRELIVCREDQTPAHHSATRPSVTSLLENYALGEVGVEPVRDRVVLFDDLVTSGNHFVACRKFLLGHFPGREVMGIFLARRVLA